MNWFNSWPCFVDKFDPFAAEPTAASKSPVNVGYIYLLFRDWRLSFVNVILCVIADMLKIYWNYALWLLLHLTKYTVKSFETFLYLQL